jgi:hypothetical protein
VESKSAMETLEIWPVKAGAGSESLSWRDCTPRSPN